MYVALRRINKFETMYLRSTYQRTAFKLNLSEKKKNIYIYIYIYTYTYIRLRIEIKVIPSPKVVSTIASLTFTFLDVRALKK